MSWARMGQTDRHVSKLWEIFSQFSRHEIFGRFSPNFEDMTFFGRFSPIFDSVGENLPNPLCLKKTDPSHPNPESVWSLPKKHMDASYTPDDPRFCPSWLLLRSMHRLLFLCPVLGLPHEFENHCILVGRTVLLTDHRKEEPGDMFTWKARGSRIVTIMKTAPNTTIFWDQVQQMCKILFIPRKILLILCLFLGHWHLLQGRPVLLPGTR